MSGGGGRRRTRPARELYDLVADPTEQNNLLTSGDAENAELFAKDLAVQLNDWRTKTNDVIPSEFAGNRISERYTRPMLGSTRLSIRAGRPMPFIAAS